MSRTATRDRLPPGACVGDYRIEQELRSEDTGVVYAAVHLVLPRRAALKVMHPAQASIRQMAVQMLREACILEALSHPGVPRVFECGVLDKLPWVALELVDGKPLAELIEKGPIASNELVTILRALAEILEYAHARGVSHHRISERVVVSTPRRVFPVCLSGWAEVSAHDSERGTDQSTDIHALGQLAFRALTGTLLEPTASAQEQCPTSPADLTRLIDEMLAPDPRSRPTAAQIHARANWMGETGFSPPAAARTTTPDVVVRLKK
jgi:serine/threonine protein kinase